MRNRGCAWLGVMIGVTLASANSADAAQNKRTDLSDKAVAATEAGQTVETLILAYQLADHARAAGDVRALIVAARIVTSVPTGGTNGKLPGRTDDAQGLYDEAVALARGDAPLVAEIESARSEASRGVICAPGCGALRTVHQLPAGDKWTVRLNARGGEPLIVGVRREGKTGMDLKVYDEFGNLVCQDLSQRATLYCRVNPIWSGPFSAVVANHGARIVAVAMVTN